MKTHLAQTVLLEKSSNPEIYNIDGYNYFKIADLGEALGFAVAYDEATRTVEIL